MAKKGAESSSYWELACTWHSLSITMASKHSGIIKNSNESTNYRLKLSFPKLLGAVYMYDGMKMEKSAMNNVCLLDGV